MAGRETAREDAQRAADLYRVNGNSERAAATASGLARSTFQGHLRAASRYGMLLDTPAAMPGFRISQVGETQNADGSLRAKSIQQKPEHGAEPYKAPEGQILDKVSVLLNPERGEIIKWEKYRADAAVQAEQMRAVVEAFKSEIPRAEPVTAPPGRNGDLLNQYTVTDLHFGMLAWREETGADYDLKIAEQLLLDWFAAAIRQSPDAATAILCQLGDLLHHDAHESVTPAHRNVLDADSRLQKMIRVVIRTMRRIVAMLLAKHERVHIIMSDANHDPAGGAWLREMFAAFFEDEPRVTVDTSPSTYNVFEFGQTSLFYHHGHKRKIASVDSVFVGKFREIFGRTKHSYAHMGHLHSDEMKSAPTTMKVERHETLAGPDAYAANGGWLSGRSAKVITYSKRFGEVGRITLTPEMVAGCAA
jgi:hypothetical protein